MNITAITSLLAKAQAVYEAVKFFLSRFEFSIEDAGSFGYLFGLEVITPQGFTVVTLFAGKKGLGVTFR